VTEWLRLGVLVVLASFPTRAQITDPKSPTLGSVGSKAQDLVQRDLAGAGVASLKICLRLQDDSPFSGLASLRVTTSQGSEIAGNSTESEGETIFPNVPPGTYVVEASAPGFAALKQTVEIASGQHLETLFVIMKPEISAETASAIQALSPPDNPKPNKRFWIPPSVDDLVPKVAPGVSCFLPLVLHGVSERMRQFVNNLEKFTATEHVEHFRVDAAGIRHSPDVRSFEYVVLVWQDSVGTFQVEEYRNGSVDPGQFPARIATEGSPAMALIFHPLLVSDFNFACEGLGQWGGRPAWQVRFEQRQDRPIRIRGYMIAGHEYLVPLKGRAWVDAGTYQVVRLESELMKPLKGIDLTQEHLSIEYGPVQFHTRRQRLWLPQTVELYAERHGHRYYRRHTFTNFKIFTVDTDQRIQPPKESYCFTNTYDRDIVGVLTVTPVSGIALNSVSIAFTIPAGGSIFKLVGPGKDISIPPEIVGSATFVHNGPEGSVKADAYLVKESTLEVIPGSSVPLTP
jgi:hypothetical protein